MDNKLKTEIIRKIKKLLNEYLSYNVDIKRLRKYFNNKTSFNNLLKDISYYGKKEFDDDLDYRKNIKKILNDIIDDKEATIKDKKTNEGVILKYNDFIKNNII
jgi:hypothetical protein